MILCWFYISGLSNRILKTNIQSLETGASRIRLVLSILRFYLNGHVSEKKIEAVHYKGFKDHQRARLKAESFAEPSTDLM